MLEFLGGLILGAVLGVFADRLLRRFESITRVNISVSLFENIMSQKGFGFTVKNVGMAEIPLYKMCLFHPVRGSFYAFHNVRPGPLLRGQQDEHNLMVLLNGHVTEAIRQWFYPGSLDDPRKGQKGGYSLRLVMEKSERVLYENTTMGECLAEILKHAVDSNDIFGGPDAAWQGLMHMSRRWPLSLLDRIHPRAGTTNS